MDKRTAHRLARRIEREDPKVNVTGFRRWPHTDHRGNEHGARWEIDCVDTRNGYTFVVSSPEGWGERRDDAENEHQYQATLANMTPEDWVAIDYEHGDSDLLAAGDIAQLASVTTDAVQKWAHRHAEFRDLAIKTSAGLIWRRDDAEQWLRDTGRLKNRRRDMTTKTTIHRDGTVTYFSIYEQCWHQNATSIPAEELAAMNECERDRVVRALTKHQRLREIEEQVADEWLEV